MKFILGKKLEMGQKFDENGMVVPVTKVQAGPCVVTQIRTAEKDGYTAVQVGFGERKSLSKALAGHLKDLGNVATIQEFRLEDGVVVENVKRGDMITPAIFDKGEIVQVTGTSKGKGFQGVVKRHGFGGAKKTHGTKDQLRMPGSIGATGPAHVFKGTRMGGRMGGDQVTVTNLQIVDLDLENNILYIKGAIPGGRDSIVAISAEGEIDLSKKSEVAEEASANASDEVVADKPVEEVATQEVANEEAPKAEAPAEEKSGDTKEEQEAPAGKSSEETVEDTDEKKEEVKEVVTDDKKEEKTEEAKEESNEDSK